MVPTQLEDLAIWSFQVGAFVPFFFAKYNAELNALAEPSLVLADTSWAPVDLRTRVTSTESWHVTKPKTSTGQTLNGSVAMVDLSSAAVAGMSLLVFRSGASRSPGQHFI